METVKNVGFTLGEKCEVNIDSVESMLAKLPTAAYLELFHKMQIRLYGYPNFGGCCGTYEEERPELKAKIDYSEVDETMAKVEEANKVANKLNALLDEISKKDVSVYIDVEEKGE